MLDSVLIITKETVSVPNVSDVGYKNKFDNQYNQSLYISPAVIPAQSKNLYLISAKMVWILMTMWKSSRSFVNIFNQGKGMGSLPKIPSKERRFIILPNMDWNQSPKFFSNTKPNGS